jgi:hypothetical protein
VTLSAQRGGPVVLAFFPAAFSSVCTKELCTFRDRLSALNKARAKVYGISVDTFFTLKAFQNDQGLTFPITLLASTPNDGSEQVTVPAISSTMARIKVEAVGNIFFDMSDTNFTISGSCPAITLNPTTLPGGTVNSSYNQSVTASGGTAPYTYSLSSSTLPNGLTLSSAGGISGTPTEGGSFNITVKATDANLCFGTRAYSLVVACQTITLTPASLAAGSVGTSYSQSISATGGTPG